jgi:hypothetical protein
MKRKSRGRNKVFRHDSSFLFKLQIKDLTILHHRFYSKQNTKINCFSFEFNDHTEQFAYSRVSKLLFELHFRQA